MVEFQTVLNLITEHWFFAALAVFVLLYLFAKFRKGELIQTKPIKKLEKNPAENTVNGEPLERLGKELGIKESEEEKDIVGKANQLMESLSQRMKEELKEYNEKFKIAKNEINQELGKLNQDSQKILTRAESLKKTKKNLDRNIVLTGVQEQK